MPRRKPQRGRTKRNGSKKTNGTSGANGTNQKKGNGAWTPQQRGSAKAWMEKLKYTPAALRCRTLVDMSEEEISAIELEYGAKVLRPIGGEHPRPPHRYGRPKPVHDLLGSSDGLSEEMEIQDEF